MQADLTTLEGASETDQETDAFGVRGQDTARPDVAELGHYHYGDVSIDEIYTFSVTERSITTGEDLGYMLGDHGEEIIIDNRPTLQLAEPADFSDMLVESSDISLLLDGPDDNMSRGDVDFDLEVFRVDPGNRPETGPSSIEFMAIFSENHQTSVDLDMVFDSIGLSFGRQLARDVAPAENRDDDIFWKNSDLAADADSDPAFAVTFGEVDVTNVLDHLFEHIAVSDES